MPENKSKFTLNLWLAALVSALMIAVDQITKRCILATFQNGHKPITVIKGILSFDYVENDGAAFSMLAGKTSFLVIFTVIAMLGVLALVITRRMAHPLCDWGLCLVLSGGIGNLIDRLSRSGRVVDFIQTDFIDFPTFNVADICVTVGAGLLVLYIILDLIKDIRTAREEKNGNEEL